MKRKNLFGEMCDVLHVKGSGWDLDTIMAPGLPGLWLENLRRLRALDSLSDKQMVNIQRANLIGSSSPNLSVETLLHAFLPHKFVDHTHATPFLILANLPNAKEVCKEIFGTRLANVPYIMPGFALAKKAAEIFDAHSKCEGLLLLGHGHFAFGQTAKESYDLIVSHTQAVADYLQMEKPTELFVREEHDVQHVLPVIGGLAAEMVGPNAPMPVLDLRNGPEQRGFLERTDIDDLSKRGTASPDHVIRIKAKPLVLRKSVWSAGKEAIKAALDGYASEYRSMFDRQAPSADQPKKILSQDPKTIWMEEIGFIGLGNNAKAASVAGDLVVQNARVRAVGEDHGGFYPISEKDLFDCEYWSLEQAKLGKGTPPKLQGRVVMVTGGAGAIGKAIEDAFNSLGAQCFLVDQDEETLNHALEDLGIGHAGIALDVTEQGAANSAMHACINTFGGLDILVSNAGAALSGAMLDVPSDKLRDAFELGKDSIRVNGVNADRIRSGLLTDDFIAERANARGVSEEQYMASNILNKEVRAQDVAYAFTSLAQMERTTGHIITVDGGNMEAALR